MQRSKAKEVAYALKLKEAALVSSTKKSGKLVYEKVARDIGAVMDFLDHERKGFFSISQVGQAFVMLKVFTAVCAEKDSFNEQRQKREEAFLLNFWHLVNPLNSDAQVERQVL